MLHSAVWSGLNPNLALWRQCKTQTTRLMSPLSVYFGTNTSTRLRRTVAYYHSCLFNYHMQWTAEGSVFNAVSQCFLFVYEISREPLNAFAPNSQGKRVWSLALTNLRAKVKSQMSRSPDTKKRHFGPCQRPACGLRVFGKTSLASS